MVFRAYFDNTFSVRGYQREKGDNSNSLYVSCWKGGGDTLTFEECYSAAIHEICNEKNPAAIQRIGKQRDLQFKLHHIAA
jgi:hypothetical protein